MPLNILQEKQMSKKHFTSVISEKFGKFASKEFSPTIQNFINATYVKLMGLDMSEFREPNSYKSLNKLFTRALETPREIPSGKSKLLCGVDALITDAGTITERRAYQIKGMSYSIEELFGEYHKEAVANVEGGEFINFYLSPKDYHRYHMPMSLKIHSLTHIPGKLYPVNFPLLRNKTELFIENERVVIECEDAKGRMHVLVLVGALNVGKMIVSFEKSVQTNSEIREARHYTYENLTLERGELFGWFEMGSTLLTFSQKGSIVPNVAINQKVSFADVLGKVK
jgi:phosphatidylserine decarboxylase